MAETQTTFQSIAAELASAFERKTRDDGTTFYKLKDDAPDWLQGSDVPLACHKALDDRFPDDWVYETMAAIADNLHDHEFESADDARETMGEIADSLVDVYNADLSKWLSSHLNNAFLCDDAAEEFGPAEDTFKHIARGQYVAIERIGYALIEAIEEEAEAREEDDE